MVKKTAFLIAVTVILSLAIVSGEILTYCVNTHSYDSDAEFSYGTVSYSVSSNGSDVYSAVLFDNGAMEPVSKLYIYVDESYDRYLEDVLKKDSVQYFEEQYYAEQIQKALKFRGFDDVTLIDSDGLTEMIGSTLSDPIGIGLFVTSYSLPSGIYTGTSGDRIFSWIDNGGSLYWTGSEIGRYYRDSDGMHRVSDNQMLFFGSECVNTDSGLAHATSSIDNGFREALSLKNSGMEFALNTSGLTDSLSIGYSENGYSSISFVKHGSGMICVMGTMPEIMTQLDDTAQIIASGVTYDSKIIRCDSGKVTRSTVSRIVDFNVTLDVHIYIYIGGTYTVYGRSYA